MLWVRVISGWFLWFLVMVVCCVKCGVVGLTCRKRADLDHEFEGFQWWMQFGVNIGILSQHMRAKGYNYKLDKIKYRDYPLVIPGKQVWFRKQDTKLTPYWVKISVRKRKGVGIWLPIKPHKELPNIKYLRDSLLLKNHKGNYELRLIFDIPREPIIPKNVLAIDLGERVIAAVRGSSGHKGFYGKNLRSIRAHYMWLRRQLGKKKLLKKIKTIGAKEKNKVNNELHCISNQIIKLAKETKSLIVVGYLQGLNKINKYRRINRIVRQMPYHKLTQMLRYKAAQQGLQLLQISERYTSQQCHRCGHTNKKNRKTQGLFVCEECGLQYNADLNAATNILNRAKEQRFLARATANAPKPTLTELISTKQPTTA